jgi:hypothetical protein
MLEGAGLALLRVYTVLFALLLENSGLQNTPYELIR